MVGKAALARMRISFPNRPSARPGGYVLISVLFGLVLVTTFLVAAQRLSLETTTEVALAEQQVARSDLFADLVAVSANMAPSDKPQYIEEFGLWVLSQNARGLVDLNAAPEELVIAVLGAEGLDTPDIVSRLNEQRMMSHDMFFSLASAFDHLGIPKEKRASFALYVTVVTGHVSVDPNVAAPEISALLSRTLTRLDLEPLGESSGEISRIAVSETDQRSFKPLFYIQKNGEIDARLRSVLTGL